MYLTRIDQESGLLKIEDGQDGILAVKEFRTILENNQLGLECLTAIALTADYLTPIRHYNDKDRPRKAMEEVVGDRDRWPWNIEPIQEALKKYDALQYDPTLEEGRIYHDQKIRKLKEIQEWDTLPADSARRAGKTMTSMKTELRAINKDIDDFKKRTDGQDLYANAPVDNGYKLSRLEQKLLKKKSFYTTVR